MNTAFYSEIKAQPEALLQTIDAYAADGYRLLHQAAEMIKAAPAVMMSGMGTSYNVCLSVQGELGKAGRVSAVQSYQLLQDGLAGLRNGDLLILISQSGESGEIVELCRRCKGKNKIIGISNNMCSTLAGGADLVLPLYSAEEKSITNSTFTASLAVLALLCACVNGDCVDRCAQRLRAGAGEAQRALISEKQVFDAADAFGLADRVHFIGRSGMEMALAEQAALIFKEGADCNAQCFNVGAFRHGPIELCGKGHVGVLYAADSESAEVMAALGARMRQNGSHTLTITNCPAEGGSLRVNCGSAEGFAAAAAVITEMLTVRAARNRGKEAGVFRISGKICREI